MLPVDIFPWVVQSPAVTGSATRYAPCGPQRGMSMASASGHTVPGGAPSLGSLAACGLAVG
jgi:hypothetical protein